jgi:hypothetical protein
MSRIQYTEQQSFRQVLWIWLIIIPIAFLSSLGILFGFYQQLILGEPWGNMAEPIMISTENKEEFERAMQKLMSKSENY